MIMVKSKFIHQINLMAHLPFSKLLKKRMKMMMRKKMTTKMLMCKRLQLTRGYGRVKIILQVNSEAK